MADISNIFPRQPSAPIVLAPTVARMAMPWDRPRSHAVAVVTMPKMTSGYGQYHTNDSDPKKPEKRLTPYVGIDLAGIRDLVDNPQVVDKPKAQWFIPSTLSTRNFAEQEQNGVFWMLWADLDSNPKPISDVGAILRQVIIPDCDFELYASKSAREDYQKARILVPLNKPLFGSDWMLCQEVLGDKLEATGIHLAACTSARCTISNKNNASALNLGNIARTGEGKNAGKNAVGRCLSRAFEQTPISSFSSASGIFSALRHSPSAVFHLDEFGDKLRHGLNDRGGFISGGFSFLKEVYSQPLDPLLPKAFAEIGMSSKQREQFRKDNGPIQHPHLNLLAVTTPGQFHDAVTDAMVEGGMLNRFIWVEAGSKVVENADFDSTPPEWLILHMQAVRKDCGSSGASGNLEGVWQHDPDCIPSMRRFNFCDQSMALLNAFKEEIKQLSRHDEFYADMTRRWRENAMRMALALHAFSDHQNPTINVAIVQWSIDYVRHHGKHFIKKLYELAAPSEKYGQRRKAYLAAFRARPDGVTTHVMGKYAPWRDDNPNLRRQIIEDMLNSGDIAIVLGDKPARGTAPKLYVALA